MKWIVMLVALLLLGGGGGMYGIGLQKKHERLSELQDELAGIMGEFAYWERHHGELAKLPQLHEPEELDRMVWADGQGYQATLLGAEERMLRAKIMQHLTEDAIATLQRRSPLAIAWDEP